MKKNTSNLLDEVKEEICDNSKKVRVAINGFGRIGRMIFKAGFDDPNIEFVAINDLSGAESLKYLLKYDSAQGNFPHEIKVEGENLVIGDKKIKVLAQRDIHSLPWAELKIDVVAECTGIFTDADQTKIHIAQGAKKVVISAPGKGECFYLVRGVNDEEYNSQTIVSNGSCTTNSISAIMNEIDKKFGIEKGMFATIHSVTGDQRVLDIFHKGDPRRGRAATFNIIPTSTGAAKSVIKLIPHLGGKFHGIAYRVPTITGSITDLNLELKKNTSTDEINKFLKDLSLNSLQGIIEYSEDPLVSSDIVSNPHSGIIDSLSTKVIDNNSLKLAIWYDNEWGFSNRMIEVIKLINNS